MKNISEPTVKTKIDALNEIISNEEAEENRAKIVENFGKLREGLKKKTGLFSDIDQISFNTHPPPPKDDI